KNEFLTAAQIDEKRGDYRNIRVLVEKTNLLRSTVFVDFQLILLDARDETIALVQHRENYVNKLCIELDRSIILLHSGFLISGFLALIRFVRSPAATTRFLSVSKCG